MPNIRTFTKISFFIIACFVSLTCTQVLASPPSWPEVKTEAKPWTRWWWFASAVNEKELDTLLKTYSDAGLGGVEITPIYGVSGLEKKYIDFLSPAWMSMLTHTVESGRGLGIGVDMATGTGWPFGGPNVTPEIASKKISQKKFELKAGESLSEDFSPGVPVAAVAVSQTGKRVAVEIAKGNNSLRWTAPEGDWAVYALVQWNTMQKVKRAAPGGEGLVLDHFSRAALDTYLERFTAAFKSSGAPVVRSFFDDSFEVYGANWTDDFLKEFKRRRGYNLADFLPEFSGDGDPDKVARVKYDFRETLSELLLERFAVPWTAWSHKMGAITRYQAHGSPGNLLDLYAAADIPETETFGPSLFDIPGLTYESNEKKDKPDPLMFRFAASPAHVTGKKLVSSESCTWLGEHFKVPLSVVKPELDQLFVSGINHVVYQGTAYSPPDARWPGWQFYAAVEFSPQNTIWRDLSATNAYIARVQSFLQAGKPDNDVLLYWPVHDEWQSPDGLEKLLTVHAAAEWLRNSEFGKIAETLLKSGYTFDYISDKQIKSLAVRGGALASGGTEWKTVVVPRCKFMPVETMDALAKLARSGATVAFIGDVPRDVPGLANRVSRRAGLRKILSKASIPTTAPKQLKSFKVGKGFFIIGSGIKEIALKTGLRRELIADTGLSFIRRKLSGGEVYFITNLGPKAIDDYFKFGTKFRDAAIFDPMNGDIGAAAIRKTGAARAVRLQIPSGGSVILKTYDSAASGAKPWRYVSTTGEPFEITGTWEVKFIDGGPKLPEDAKIDKLVSWTEFGGAAAKYFSGTAEYSITFNMPDATPDSWLLDLGRVAESARVRLNGADLGTLWAVPFRIDTRGLLRKKDNRLVIEVTNLAANRIIQMDKKGTPWKIFRDANILDMNYKPLNAATWKPLESGLIGSVRLIPINP